jgi:hypothetical protein
LNSKRIIATAIILERRFQLCDTTLATIVNVPEIEGFALLDDGKNQMPCHSYFPLIVGVTVSAAVASAAPGASITYMGVIYDRTDLARLNIGNAGFWFPQFDAAGPVSGRPTGENARDGLPSWAGPLNHATSISDPNFATRTFSQDGPARSKGGQPGWDVLRLPNGEIGLSGAIVDPHTRGNSNNTINRIQLNAGVPGSFYFHVLTDNTNMEHNPTNRLRARGNAGGVDIEANTYPQTAQLAFNGITDIYTFRYDGFAGGDFIKLQLNGDPVPALGASFGGFLLDVTFAPDVSQPYPGDYNDDGAVDAADYIVWRKTEGDSGYFLPADGDPNYRIDSQDHDVWQTHFGSSTETGLAFIPPEVPAVPEPTSLLMVVVTTICRAGATKKPTLR